MSLALGIRIPDPAELLYCVSAANMRAFFENHLGRNTLKFLVGAVLIISGLPFRADQLSLVPVPPVEQDPEWVLGPGKSVLSDFGKIEVPDGYRFCAATGARTLLLRMKNPIPANLVGVLAPNNGKWWIVLAFSDIGYVKGMNQNTRIDAQAVLDLVRENLKPQNDQLSRQGMSPISAVDWTIKPVFDARNNSLEWALRAETRTEKIVNLQAETETQSADQSYGPSAGQAGSSGCDRGAGRRSGRRGHTFEEPGQPHRFQRR